MKLLISLSHSHLLSSPLILTFSSLSLFAYDNELDLPLPHLPTVEGGIYNLLRKEEKAEGRRKKGAQKRLFFQLYLGAYTNMSHVFGGFSPLCQHNIACLCSWLRRTCGRQQRGLTYVTFFNNNNRPDSFHVCSVILLSVYAPAYGKLYPTDSLSMA